MNKQQQFQAGLDAIQAKDWQKFRTLVTSDYTFIGGPMPFDLETFIAVQDAIQRALPDFAFHVDRVQPDGDGLLIDLHVTATHTASLSLPMPGAPTIPPSNKHFTIPDKLKVTYRGDKVATIEAQPVPNGGIGGLLRSMGLPV